MRVTRVWHEGGPIILSAKFGNASVTFLHPFSVHDDEWMQPGTYGLRIVSTERAPQAAHMSFAIQLIHNAPARSRLVEPAALLAALSLDREKERRSRELGAQSDPDI